MGTRTRAIAGIGCAVVGLAAIGGIAYAQAKRDRHPETVVVPGIRSGGLLFAFDQLRGAGLKVAIPSAIPFRPTSSPSVSDQMPRGGTRVKWGTVVTLTVNGGQIGSVGVRKPLPVYRVPDFRERPLSDAAAWTEGKMIYWTSELPPLPPSSAKHLLDAYVVKSQRPAKGSQLKLGTPTPNGIRLTPLMLETAVR